MHAVIHRSDAIAGAGMAQVAGRPLIIRQLQWLRASGHGPVAVELGTDEVSRELAVWLQERDAIGVGVELVTSRRPLSAREIARRAGFPEEAALLAVPADVVLGGDLGPAFEAAGERDAVVRLSAPPGIDDRRAGADLRVVRGAETEPVTLVESKSGWAMRVRSLADALALSMAALTGAFGDGSDATRGMVMHAAEVEPGIWMGRGVLVEEGAILRAPLLLGAHSVVCRGAVVGPSVCVGDRAVIEAETTLESSLVRAGTIVGEGLVLRDLAIDAQGVADLATGFRQAVHDSLVLASRDGAMTEELVPVMLELVVVVVVTPLTALVELMTSTAAGARDALPMLLGDDEALLERA